MTSPEASALPSRTPHWRKVLGFLLVGVASLFAVIVGGLLLLMWSCEPPSIDTLASRFPRQRKDLETIILMSDQDAQLTRIDPDWLQTSNHQYLSYSPETGITLERWNEYRRLFVRNDITQGIQRDPATRDAFILVKSVGLLNRGTSNGFLYCGPGPTHRYLPCSLSDPEGEHPYSRGDEAYSYRKLADHWYAFSEGPS
jgi:hypothetical protein